MPSRLPQPLPAASQVVRRADVKTTVDSLQQLPLASFQVGSLKVRTAVDHLAGNVGRLPGGRRARGAGCRRKHIHRRLHDILHRLSRMALPVAVVAYCACRAAAGHGQPAHQNSRSPCPAIFPGLDPSKDTSPLGFNYRLNVFDCLTELTPNGEMNPRLAKSWTLFGRPDRMDLRAASRASNSTTAARSAPMTWCSPSSGS